MKAGEHASRENTIFRLKQTSLGRASIHPIQIMKLHEFNTIEKNTVQVLGSYKISPFYCVLYIRGKTLASEC